MCPLPFPQIDENGDGVMDRSECCMLMKGIIANTVADMESRPTYSRLANRCEALRRLLQDKGQLNALVTKVFRALGNEDTEEVTQREFTRFFKRIIT